MARDVKELRDRKSVITPSFQFSLRSIFWLTLIVAAGTLFLREIQFRFGPVATAVTVLTLLSIFAHVAGAALGSRLRSSPDMAPQDDEDEEEPSKHLLQPTRARQTDFAPTTQLSEQKPLERKPIYIAIGSGAFIAATVASIILTWFMWDNLAIANVLFGAVSAAVIGGIFGYLISSLYQVVRDALAEAQEKS